MRAIVTGATGLIGSRFVKLYGSSFKKLYQLGRSRAPIRAEWIDYDFSSGLPLVLPEVDAVFHFAGQTSVYISRDDVLRAININTIGFVRMLDTLRKQDKLPFVVFAGTATQVGFTDERKPLDKDYCNNPISFYDISKLAAENYLLQYVREGWIKGCSLRLCNVYGGRKNGYNLDRGVIDKIFQKAIKGESISIFGSGNYLRDYIHIDDVVSAFFTSLKHFDRVNGKYFNIGTGQGIILKDAFNLVVRLAEEVSGQSVEIKHIEPPENISLIEFRSFIADMSKYKDATGWTPNFTLEEGVRHSYINFFKRSF